MFLHFAIGLETLPHKLPTNENAIMVPRTSAATLLPFFRPHSLRPLPFYAQDHDKPKPLRIRWWPAGTSHARCSSGGRRCGGYSGPGDTDGWVGYICGSGFGRERELSGYGAGAAVLSILSSWDLMEVDVYVTERRTIGVPFSLLWARLVIHGSG